MNVLKNIKKILSVLALIALISTNLKATDECFESTSRAIFKFNMAFDDVILEPLAKGYNKLPSPIKSGTSNFTSNIGILLSIPNNILQGNFKQLGHSVGSFTINSTVGILGLLNPALIIVLPKTLPQLPDFDFFSSFFVLLILMKLISNFPSFRLSHFIF